MSNATAPVLLAVHDLREEIRAGFGQTRLAVRTLDGVSLALRSGELVVIRGGVASGATSLLGALTGARAVDRRSIDGTRVVARGVQIRRGRISVDALRVLIAAWSSPLPAGLRVEYSATPVVYVFRVRATSTPIPLSGATMWREWAVRMRSRGGSVLAHVPISAHMHATRDMAAEQSPSAVHEATSETGIYASDAGNVRLLTLSAGRIVKAHARIKSD